MLKIIKIIIVALSIIFSSSTLIFAQTSESLVVDDQLKSTPLCSYMDCLEDSGKNYTIDIILSQKFDSLFKKVESPIISKGYTKSAFWFRYSLYNKSENQKTIIIEIENPYLKSIEFFKSHNNKVITKISTGSKYRYKKRKINHRNFLFRIKLEPKESSTYYFRIITDDFFGFLCTAWDENSFNENEPSNQIIHGILFGILIIVCLFNIVVFIIIRDRGYLYFALFALSFTILLVAENGYGFQYLWPSFPIINHWIYPILNVVAILFYTLFSQNFLHLYQYTPKLNKSIYYGIIITLLCLLPFFILKVIYLSGIIEIISLITPILFLTLAIYVFSKGYKPARIYLLSFSFVIITIIIFLFSVLGILNFSYTIIYALYIAIILTVTTMGFSLLDRYLIINYKLAHERNTLKERNELIENELIMAMNIQNKLIPEKNPLDTIFSIYYPIDKIGGDFYDFLQLDDDRIGIFISDVSGHGVPAAFITTMVKSVILQAGKLQNDPAKLLFFLNDALFELTGENFITCFYGIYNHKTNHIMYSNAGHPSPLIITDNDISQLPGTIQMPIAMWDEDEISEMDKIYENNEMVLPENSKLLLYTDGMTEVRKAENKNEFLNKKMIFDLCLQNKELDSKQFLYKLFRELISFRESYIFDDDICIICVDI